MAHLSVETILTAPVTREVDNMSDWSTVWSTTHVPGMDTATGAGSLKKSMGRRRLRNAAHSICCLLAMHCRVTAIALKGSFFVFLLTLTAAIGILGNPLRHFEVYLGQWSISGPGRAFRIIPMFDGVGIAICINALTRAITCSVMGAITAVYVLAAVSDKQLPFEFCRDNNLKAYNASLKQIDAAMLNDPYASLESGLLLLDEQMTTKPVFRTVGTQPHAWRNLTQLKISLGVQLVSQRKTYVCKETFDGTYPTMYLTPPYNYFYVEVIRHSSDYAFKINLPLIVFVIIEWCIIWIYMLTEKVRHKRLIWNNIYPWFKGIPWTWAVVLVVISVINYVKKTISVSRMFQIGGSRDILGSVCDAFEVAMYIHAASIGTETIHGKGLNHFAHGHIDPSLNSENVWLSSFVLIVTALHTTGAAICAITDYVQVIGLNNVRESSLWILPMYSKCTSRGDYSHFMSATLFSGLTFSYIVIAAVLFKTVLHIIFEYRVKLVFVEQYLVAGLIVLCMGLSSLFCINTGGIAYLEAVDSLMSGLCMPLICALESFGFLYAYRSHDFVSDMHIATEENMCASRLGIQWQILPFICMLLVILKIVVLTNSEIPSRFMILALIPVICVVISVPLRACRNALVFLRPKRK
ncbi:uncharacterized protein LOC113233169 isoform X2 [Hyposmocoma kahamanoa]|uniref:uncharacterized protein LOC113233169 isoform X2 n=1 Tax=Hyposmocoma kahamanoa TaxID=1477025 RepID=UPI000E6D8545|nr:uncharacterized protein LOC113233169 isoform X2 [Hyposmocoma kahamanoa]